MIFVDTSFWIAFRNVRDRHHPQARQLLHDMSDQRMVTSNQVRGETWTFLRRRLGHAAGVGFLDTIQGSERIDVVHVDAELEQRALEWLRRHDERAYSFVDATSFVLMRSMKIRKAFAFDGDFSAAGFVELRP